MMQGSSSIGPPSLYEGIWSAMAIAIVIVALRVVAKIKIRQFRVDDILMIIALILAVTSTAFLTLGVQHGFGTNLQTLGIHDAELVLMYIAIQVPLVTMSTAAARCAFILYLLAILGTNKKYRIALWLCLFLQLLSNIASAFLPLSICRNFHILWDPTIKTTCGNVVAVIQYAYFSGSLNSAVDLFLAAFPTIVFWNLNLRLRIKLGLIALLSLGLVAMVASIIKTTKLDQVPSVTNLGATGGVVLVRWGYIENVVIIITSSIPCIRPLVISSVRKLSSNNTFSRSYELSGPYSGNRRTGDTETAAWRRTRRFTKQNDDDSGSVERILTEAYSTTTSGHGPGHGHPDSPDAGIRKEVVISVVADQRGGNV